MPSNEVIHVVDELEDATDRVLAIEGIASAADLLELARYYNWDDGLQVPHAIIDHPACDLGVALHVFELAEGTFYLASPEKWAGQESWGAFCRTLSERILGGRYPIVMLAFESSLMRVQKYNLAKAGVPSIFFESVSPQTSQSEV